jgi:SSS family solute:Na+ symporter/sodium/proline symporter
MEESDLLAAGEESFFTANRRVGALFGAMSLTATQVSAGTMIGTIGIHYTVGIGFALVWIGIWLGWLFSMVFIAPQLREAGGFTISNFLAERFGTGDGHVRSLAAVFIALIYLVYTTAQYVAGGILLESVFGLEQFFGVILVAVLALSYTVLGGMLFSVYSDAIQVLTLLAGLCTATVVALGDVGGVGQLVEGVAAIDEQLLSLSGAPAFTLGLTLSFGFGIAIAPFEMSRVYAMRSPETVRRAIPLSIGIQSIIAVCIATIGLVARFRFPELDNPDMAVVKLSLDLFGPFVGGLLLLAVIAGILSTVDSVLLVSSAAISHDLLNGALPAAGAVESLSGEHGFVTINRLVTVAAAVIPVGLTLFSGYLGGLIQLIVALYTSLLAGTLFVPVLAGLYWTEATKSGVISGMTAGILAVLFWQLGRVTGLIGNPLSRVDPIVPGLLVSLLAITVVSWADF